MKLYSHIKQLPEDFVVEEVPDISIKESGKVAVYKLSKRNVSTIEALRVLSKFLKFPLRKLGFAGLKDKYAITYQYITVPKGLFKEDFYSFEKRSRWRRTDKKELNGTIFFLEKVGYSEKFLSLGDIKENIFTVKVRNFEKNMRERFYKNLEIVRKFGFANYFGEQRFGSVKSRDDFVLRYILKGDFETALKVYFLGKEEIGVVTDWEKIYKTLKPTLEEYEKDLISALLKGKDFETAFKILPKNVRLMFNFAFQSYLWNRILAEYLKKKYPGKELPFINNWKLFFYTDVTDFDYLEILEIPYTGSDYEVRDVTLKTIMRKVFKEEGVTFDVFNREVAGMKVMTDGLRKAVVKPKNLKILGKTKKDITLRFSLPSGSYATVLLRKLLAL